MNFLSSNIKKLRHERNIEIQDIAYETNLSIATIQRIEDGKTELNQLETIVKLSRFFDIRIHDLINKEL